MTHTPRQRHNARSAKTPQVDRAAKIVARKIEQGGVPIPRNNSIVLYEFTPGSKRCQCMRCGHVFSSITSFDAHQTLNEEGGIQCWEPSSVGLVCRDGVWGQAGDRPIELLRGEVDA